MHHMAGSGTLSPEDLMKYLVLVALLFASPIGAVESSDLNYEAMAQVAVRALELQNAVNSAWSEPKRSPVSPG